MSKRPGPRLRSLTRGTGFFPGAYDHLNPLPERIAESVVAHQQEAAQAS